MTRLYIIRDTLAGSPAGPLVVLEHDAVAVRMFREILGDKNSMVSRFANDHELIDLGAFDRSSCAISAQEPRVVITGAVLSAIIEAEAAVPA